MCWNGSSRRAGSSRKRVGRIDLQGPTAVVEVPEGWEVRLARRSMAPSFAPAGCVPGRDAPRLHGSDEDHFQRLARLLDLECAGRGGAGGRQARATPPADAERSGRCLTDLIIAEESSGLGGRCLLTLVKRNRTLDLPWTRLQAGSPVLLRAEDAAPASGTARRRLRTRRSLPAHRPRRAARRGRGRPAPRRALGR